MITDFMRKKPLKIRRVKLKVSEKDVQRAILDYLSIKKVFHWRNNTGGFMRDNHFYKFGFRGSADIFALKDGKLYAIEVKSSTGILSDDQKEFLDNVNKNGGLGIMVKSLEEVQMLGL